MALRVLRGVGWSCGAVRDQVRSNYPLDLVVYLWHDVTLVSAVGVTLIRSGWRLACQMARCVEKCSPLILSATNCLSPLQHRFGEVIAYMTVLRRECGRIVTQSNNRVLPLAGVGV